MCFAERTTRTERARRLIAFAALAITTTLPAVAVAQVPNELQGDWSSAPPRCEQVDGEADLLTVNKSSLSFYEIGCEKLSAPKSEPTGIKRFEAMCFKGGSPETKGWVELSRGNGEAIYVKLIGFPWIAPTVETFHRCTRPK
jgi:hypothetical protein